MSATIDFSNPQAGAGRPLPKKEADLFKNVVKHYELKQYKKAIKLADTILKKFPKHGETLAMKGLTLNYMSKRDEAHALVKEGLMNDMRSHVCWHVYGLLHRADHDYIEAIKAYKQALRVDPQNMQILRDLSMLQIQMRDLHGFAITRNTLLTLKPNAKINWMAFALARHLSGDLLGAAKVIDIYLGTLSEGSAELGRCFESSELALYKNSILAEIPNNFKEALDHLTTCEAITVDRTNWLIKRAEYQLKLKDYSACLKTTNQLFERGSTETYRIHSIVMCALLKIDEPLCNESLQLQGTQTLATMIPMSDDQKKILLDMYLHTLGPKFPQSVAIQKIPFTLFNEEEFDGAIKVLCRKDIRKGVPSLCAELRSFLLTTKNGRNVQTIDPVDVKRHPRFKMFTAIVEDYISCLSSVSKFSVEDEVEEPPSTILWAWFLRAGLHELAGEYKEGLEWLERCLSHDPTEVDVYELKARFLKAIGNINGAVECLDNGRELDKQDRYINNQTTKYMLQAGMEEESLKRISLFTRHEGNAEQNLYDMQCSWYELELAECLARKEDWGRSLKKYFAIVKHFEDFVEDQFDFHSYCLRKVTLRSYISLLRFEDKVYEQQYYCIAASGIIRIYLHLYDNPTDNDDSEPDYTNMNAAEKKKAKAIARKKKKASEKKEAEIQTKKEDNGNQKLIQKGGKPPVVDEDPLGKEYLKKDPLDQAKKFSSMLADYAPKNLETWLLQYDVAIRRKKTMLALQALFKAKVIDSESSEVFSRIIDFASKMNTFETVASVKQVLTEEAPILWEKKSLSDFILRATDKIKHDPLTDLPMRTEVAKACFQTKTGSVSDACLLITDGGIESRKVSILSCRYALDALKSFAEEADVSVRIWTETVAHRFPKFE